MDEGEREVVHGVLVLKEESISRIESCRGQKSTSRTCVKASSHVFVEKSGELGGGVLQVDKNLKFWRGVSAKGREG